MCGQQNSMGQVKVDLFILQSNQAQPGVTRAPKIVTSGCEQPGLGLFVSISLPWRRQLMSYIPHPLLLCKMLSIAKELLKLLDIDLLAICRAYQCPTKLPEEFVWDVQENSAQPKVLTAWRKRERETMEGCRWSPQISAFTYIRYFCLLATDVCL